MDQITPRTHAATPESARARLAPLNWEDPFGIDSLLTEEERMIRDTARAYCQDKLAARVIEANRHEIFQLPEGIPQHVMPPRVLRPTPE